MTFDALVSASNACKRIDGYKLKEKTMRRLKTERAVRLDCNKLAQWLNNAINEANKDIEDRRRKQSLPMRPIDKDMQGKQSY